MNGGSDNGSPSFTSTNGNWSTVTNQFIPTDGTNPWLTVAVGQFAHVFVDAATTPVFIAKVTAVVNAVNGAITLDASIRTGVAPTTSATTRSIRIGGAFKGPNAADGWPLRTNMSTCVAANAMIPRVNCKNNGLYSITAAIAMIGGAVYQGYASTPGDGGKANIDAGSLTISGITGNAACFFYDLIFSNIVGTFINGPAGHFVRCIWHDITQAGISLGATNWFTCAFYECEFYNCNTINSNNVGCITGGNGSSFSTLFCYNCYFHDCTSGVNASGLAYGASSSLMVVQNCIFDNLTGWGINCRSSASFQLCASNNTFYKITGNAIGTDASVSFLFYWRLWNNLFIKINKFGISGELGNRVEGFAFNNAFGSGSMGCASGNYQRSTLQALQTYGDIVLEPGVDPFNAASTGDFSLVEPTLWGVGRASFTQTGNSKTGTLSYPDVGATYHRDLGKSSTSSAVIILPDGFKNHVYEIKESFADLALVISIPSGALPTGLALSNPSPGVWLITGTPTVLGVFNYVIRLTIGAVHGDTSEQITIYDDPDEGSGGMGGM